jgi:membrane protease subunit HflC
MQNIWENHRSSIVALGVLILVALSFTIVVPEEEQAVVIRTGEPVRVVNQYRPNQEFGETGAGIQWRIPIIEQVQRIDKRIMDLDMTSQQVLSSDQQRLLVDAYARFRVIDPVKMVKTASTADGARVQLEPILNSVLRQELGRRTFAEMLTAERSTAMANIRTNLDLQARRYGVQILDVQIKRTDLPEGTPLEAAFERMKTDRNREAITIRSQGRRDATIIQAEAEAEAARIYAESFGKDAEFYDFYRAMKSYDMTFSPGATGESSIILSPENEYLRQFRGAR